MDINIISSINCETRNNYDKKMCNNLNPDKIQNFLRPYISNPLGNNSYFDKNMFVLEEEDNILKNTLKEDCAIHSIDNNYQGFEYKGDKNKCILFKSNNSDKKIDNNLNKYNLKSFNKTKNTIDIKNLEDQLDPIKYFTQINNYGFIPKDMIKDINVENESECMGECIKNSNNCSSVLYMETPKECTFYKKKNMKHTKDKFNNYDTYSIKNKKIEDNNNLINNLLQNDMIDNNNNYYYCNLNNDKCIIDYKVNKVNNELTELEIPTRSYITNMPLYNCSGLYSTNPFCTKEYNPDDQEIIKNEVVDKYSDCFVKDNNVKNINMQKKKFDNECKKKYGSEYIFDDNIFDINSMINCNDDVDNQNYMSKVKCKLNFAGDNLMIEPFMNMDTDSNISYLNICYLLILFIFIFIFIFLIYKF